MRVPTHHQSQRTLESLAQRQSEQARLQSQLGTGLRLQSPGDDPVAAAQAELARSRLARLDQDKRATQLSTSLLNTAEGALAQGVGLLQTAREALVAAGNGAYNAQDRASLATQLRSVRSELLILANSQDGAGSFLFAGQGSTLPPLSGGSAPAWNAPSGTQRIGEAGRYAAGVDGRAAFIALPQGNGVFIPASDPANTGAAWVDPGGVSQPAQLTGHNYRITVSGAPGAFTYAVEDLDLGTTVATGVALPEDGEVEVDGQRVRIGGTPAAGDRFTLTPSGQQSIFDTLDDAIAALTSDLSTPAYNEQLGRAQATLDGALDRMIVARSQIGEELRHVEQAAASGEQQTLGVTQRRSDLEDLDYAAALSQMQSNKTTLDAALSAYAAIGRSSLFDFIR